MVCRNCGTQPPGVAAFCSECGTPTGNSPAFRPPEGPAGQPRPALTPSESARDLTDGYFGADDDGAAVAAWVTSMPFLKNSILFKQLAVVVGVPWYGICVLLFWIGSADDNRLGAVSASLIR